MYNGQQRIQAQAPLPHIPLGAQEKGALLAVTLQRQPSLARTTSLATETQAPIYSIIKAVDKTQPPCASPSLMHIRHTRKFVGSLQPPLTVDCQFLSQTSHHQISEEKNSFQISRYRSKQSINIVKRDNGQEFAGSLLTYPGQALSLKSVSPICPWQTHTILPLLLAARLLFPYVSLPR